MYRLFNLIIALFVYGCCYAQQGPGIRLEGESTSGNIPVFGVDKNTIIDSGIKTDGFVSTTNYYGTNAVWKFTTLSNGVAIEVYNSRTSNWVSQIEYVED